MTTTDQTDGPDDRHEDAGTGSSGSVLHGEKFPAHDVR
jgi:hypothetical protein